MSKNPYFAHLPTWRNRQDLAYAIDSLPAILETLTASSPLLATYSYPSTTPSSTRSTSPSSSSASGSLSSSQSSSYSSSSSSSSSSTTITMTPMSPSSTSYSSPSSSTTSSYVPSSSTSATGSSSPAKSKASAFKERFVLDLAKECHRSLTKSPSPPSATSTTAISTSNNVSTATNTPMRRVSGSVQHQQQQQQQHQDQNNRNVVASSYYPLQFSTRARAMAYLIEILQSLQKEHCGCDLVKGCYCGQDGIEDHEGKSPCYVCGEWYPDRRDSIRNVGGGGGGRGGGYEGDMDSMRRQGKSWHEQGSLRHHVAEAKVKKWLDSVWKPPLAPATTPEQDNVRQFGLRSQEDLRQCFDHPHYQQQHHQYQQQQQHSARMESARPWSVHDIEIEARAKSRSRNNSASSNSSMSFAASSSAYYPPTASSYSAPSPQQDLSGSAYGYGSSSGQWHFTTSPATHSAGTSYAPPSPKSIQATPPSQRVGSLFWAPPPPPPLPATDSHGVQFFDVDNHGYQARVRTMSCTDAPPPTGNTSLYLGTPISSLRSSTPPVMRSSSYHTNHVNNASNNSSSSSGIDKYGRSKPVRASTTNSTFSIPQEILDPNYKSPTFRIKSWSPSSSSSTGNGSSSSASPASSAFPPIASRLSFLKESSPSSASGTQPQKKQTLDEWTAAAEEKIKSKSSSSSPSELSSSAQESVLKSSKMNRSDQEDCCIAASPPPEASGQQGNTREDPTSPTSASSSGSPVAAEGLGAGVGGVRAFEGEEVKKSAPFQFNFTSTRFRAAVQAKASMDSLKSAAAVAQTRVGSERGGGVQSESVQKSAAVLDEGVLHVQSRLMTVTADTNNIKSVSDGGRHKNRVEAIVGTTIPVPVDVVIITEETVLRETDEDLEELVAAAVSIAPSKTPPTGPSSPSRSTNTLLSIQKSASMSPPTFLSNGGSGSASALAYIKSTHSHHHHLTVTTSSLSSSSTASTSASASSSASFCSLDPRSPNKSSCGDIQRARSWTSLQKWMQTMTVTTTTTATVATLPPQNRSMLLHVETSSPSC